jgi:hypothetical protein
MTFNNYLPPKTYAFLVQIQQEYKLSMKEVQRIFIDKIIRDLGFKCDHERIGHAKSDREPYCKDCWTRLRKEIRPTYRIGSKLISGEIQYLEKETFLDDFYREQDEKKRKTEMETEGEALNDGRVDQEEGNRNH